jgi:hypothetical protein
MMPGPHSAEVIKSAIEQMVNRYDFDKSKIKGSSSRIGLRSLPSYSDFFKAVVCDEGSSLVRLFSQISNEKNGLYTLIIF